MGIEVIAKNVQYKYFVMDMVKTYLANYFISEGAK